MAGFAIRKETRSSYDEVLSKLPDLLKAEGFGVLTQIDVKETLKQKIGVDFRRYKILGACNPLLAHKALSAETEIGVMLPCNVIVYEDDQGKAVVGMNALQFLVDHGASVLFWVVFVEQVGLPIPAIPLLVAAGALVGAGKMSLATALLIPVAASLPPDLAWYYLGRAKGGKVLRGFFAACLSNRTHV